MRKWQRISLRSGHNVGEPDDLPSELQGLEAESLANLSWVDEALGYAGVGFLPVDLPDPQPRAELPKSTVTARLRAIDKFNDVWALLQTSPDMFDKWYTPDWPNVFCDDERLLQALAAVGLTEEQIAEVVAV